jgi:hypothetical protein
MPCIGLPDFVYADWQMAYHAAIDPYCTLLGAAISGRRDRFLRSAHQMAAIQDELL